MKNASEEDDEEEEEEEEEHEEESIVDDTEMNEDGSGDVSVEEEAGAEAVEIQDSKCLALAYHLCQDHIII